MRYVTLPGTELRVSALGLGTWGLGGVNEVDGTACGWSRVDPTTARATIRAALDCGITLFDTADFYGRGAAEELLGEILPKGAAVVATKVGILPRMVPGTDDLDRDFSRTHILAAVERSLRRLRRECLDILQLHGPGPEVLTSLETIGVLEDLRASGKVRAWGISVRGKVTAEELNGYVGHQSVRVIQTPYSLLDLAGMLRIGQMRPKRCALFGRSLFGHGLLAEVGTKYGTEDHRARKWITMRPLVNSALAELQKRGIDSPAAIREALIAHALSAGVIDVALLGSTRPSQVLENVAAAERAARLTDIIAAVEDVINSSA